MIFEILIDRDSIRPNPNAGQTEIRRFGPTRTTMMVSFAAIPAHRLAKETAIEEFVEGHGGRAVRSTVEGNVVEMQLELPETVILKEFAERLKKMIDADRWLGYRGIHVNQRRDVHTDYLLRPEPPYLYQFLDTEVECDSCGARFSHTELQSDEADVDTWSNAICPRCGEWDCCEFVHEQFTKEMAEEACGARDATSEE